jgi:hypothetical protein
MPSTGSENSTRLGTDPRSAMRTSILAYNTMCLPHRNASTAAQSTPSWRGRQRINSSRRTPFPALFRAGLPV